jgi:glycosyltransferase involved in cell wall biosynthesis
MLTTSTIKTNLPKFGFIMTQVAGHTTYFRTIKPLISSDSSIQSVWHEVHYFKAGGLLENIRAKLSFLPGYPFGILRASADLWQGLRREKYAALFLNSQEGIFFTPLIKRIPTIFDADATPLQIDRLEGYDNSEDYKFVANLKYKLFRNLVHSTRYITAWSEWARQSFITDYGMPPERVLINPPGVNLEVWHYTDRHDRLNENAPVRILFVGGDFRRKGGEFLLDWFKQQPEGKCVLDIVTREPVEPFEGVNLYYDMKPNTPALMKLYQEADIFVLPSLGECFGIATIEAMATGLPVIQSNVGGVHDIIQAGVNGFIIEPKSLEALDKVLQALINNPAKRLAMGLAGRKIAETKFDIAKNAQKLIQHLKAISL